MSILAGPAPLIDLNPLDWLGDKAKEGLADAWTAAMISVWSAGLWLLESVFRLLDRFLTPDLTDPGLTGLYGTTVWISLAVALIVGFGQVALAAVRRDGTRLGTLVVGIAQYGAVVTCWLSVYALLVLACAGLTTGLLQGLLGVDDFAGFPAGAGWPDRVGSTVGATVLGLCSLFLLIPAGFGYVVIMLVREASLLVLAATVPIAAAGALGDGTRAWLWKSLRWFLAACLTAPLLALVLGVGVQITRAGFPDDPALTAVTATAPAASGASRAAAESSQIGMAVVGAAIMVVACFCPMALFRLLAFVDPGTGSGAALRSTLQASGGVGGLLGRGGVSSAGPGAATQVGDDGRATSEEAADAETGTRFQAAAAQLVPVAGRTLGGTMRAIGGIAQQSAAIGIDVAGQAGVGSSGYYDTARAAPVPGHGRGGGARTRQAPEQASAPASGAQRADGIGTDAVVRQPAADPDRGAVDEPRPVAPVAPAPPPAAAADGVGDAALLA